MIIVLFRYHRGDNLTLNVTETTCTGVSTTPARREEDADSPCRHYKSNYRYPPLTGLSGSRFC